MSEARENGEPAAGRALIVDDEANLRESLAEFLALDGYECVLAASGEEGLDLLARESIDAVLLDLRMPGIDGLETLARIRDSGPGVPVIMMSAHGDIGDAVEAMKRGAADYLVKPFDPAELSVRLGKAIADSRLIRLARLGERLAAGYAERDTPLGGRGAAAGIPADGSARIGQPGWLGDSPAMAAVADLVRRVAPASSTVLVTGESGTGKEVVAREIHRQSPRASGPFVPVNVGAIPESLLESELFGHEKGSFTGADARRAGLFELASGGTLFLDELGEMPAAMQVKLLRVLQERVVTRVGGSRPIPVDVRIVAATNRDLESRVREGSFREDLYFRVNVIRLRLPPLRERRADIPPLAGLFLARFARQNGKRIDGFTAEALHALSSYRFPGNVRELENVIERAVILCEGGEIGVADLFMESYGLSGTEGEGKAEGARAGDGVRDGERTRPGEGNGVSPAGNFESKVEGAPSGLAPSPGRDAEKPPAGAGEGAGSLSIREAERRAVVAALERNGGHRERTARDLGISRRTLLNKMREFELLREGR